MYETADQARARHARGEAGWQALSPAQRRGVAVGFSLMAAALVAGASQRSFNGICVLAMFAVLSGLLIVWRATRA